MSAQSATSEPLDSRRRKLRRHVDSRIVEREEFVTLLTSRRRLIRADDVGAGLRVLIDPATGEHFMIEEAKLFPITAVP